MNSLELVVTDVNGLSFDLVIDGTPIHAVLRDGNAGIPHWMVEDGLPRFGPHDADSRTRIVSVCSCGEYGCGHSRCEVTDDGRTVTFSDFRGDVGDAAGELRFSFLLAEYTSVASEMTRLAIEYRSARSGAR